MTGFVVLALWAFTGIVIAHTMCWRAERSVVCMPVSALPGPFWLLIALDRRVDVGQSAARGMTTAGMNTA